MFTYLIKSSLVLIVLLAFYKLVLEKESFFRTNRLYLLSCVLLSFLLPLLTLPTVVQHQGIVSTLLEKQVPVAESNSNATFPSTESDQKIIVESVEKDTGAFAKSTSPVTEPGTGTPAPIAWTDWVWYIYLFGVLILGLNVVAQVTNTFWKAASANDRIEDLDCTIVNIAKPTEPCSFFNYVFIHPDSYDFETYEQIVAHEKIHVQQWHSIDLLVAELLIIALWFNPFAWIFRKEIEKNIEYQTDDLLMHNSAPEQKKGYQMNLLKIATYNKPLAITTNYNQSLLRQRILKMNDKKSNAYSYWKYAFVAPLIVGLLLLINKPETMAQQPATDITPSAAVPAEERPQPATEVETTTPITAPVQPTPKKKTPPASANELSVDYCGQLRQAINATDPSRVRSLLSQFDANCLNRPQAGDFDNELL
ncbi:MAG: M56 family metallopeptidase, partial [Bacteroidota bacterium]